MNSNSNKKSSNQSNKIVKIIAITGIMAALSTILRFLEFPLSFIAPSFLKFDFSDLPALITAFAVGPIYGVIVEAIKNIIMIPFSQTVYVGELANFIIGSIFVLSAGIIYKLKPTKKSALIGMLSGTLIMTVCAAFLNYFFLIPFFANLYIPDPALSLSDKVNMMVGSFTAVIRYIDSLFKAVIISIVPFNIIKGAVISVITFIVYKKISVIFKKF